MRVAIIGGGAAGFFTAINLKEKCPEAEVVILEKTGDVLKKVKVSGGGRCNVTNGRDTPGELTKFYPRGSKKIHPLFKEFGTVEMRHWLEERGVKTKVEEDLRVFPKSNSSQEIIDCFLNATAKLGVEVRRNFDVKSLFRKEEKWQINNDEEFDAVVIAVGSSNKFWRVLHAMDLKINDPVPSLFTFHTDDPRLEGLPGISFTEAAVKVAGTKLSESGPMLITHWGLSGPAVLKLSAWGARELHEKSYNFQLVVNFINRTFEELKREFQLLKAEQPKKKLSNSTIEDLPKRFWERILEINELTEKTWGDVGKSDLNKLCEELTQGHYQVHGKSPFKEEFVTCGGVDLSEVDLNTMECRKYPGLFFGGEVLDIDALTGGFNFQACWSAGWRVSEVLADRTI